jgi:hypothetical protein
VPAVVPFATVRRFLQGGGGDVLRLPAASFAAIKSALEMKYAVKPLCGSIMASIRFCHA